MKLIPVADLVINLDQVAYLHDNGQEGDLAAIVVYFAASVPKAKGGADKFSIRLGGANAESFRSRIKESLELDRS